MGSHLPPTFGAEVAGKGWRTGAVVPHALIPSLDPYLTRPYAEHASGQENWLIVVSQTCDVVAARLEAEPLVEILHCRPIQKLRTQYKELRSTRILDFKPNRMTHADLALSAHAVADRYVMPRQMLREHAADPARRLDATATARVLAWYALRYGRPVWPDSLVGRISGTRNVLESALEPLKDDIAQVRVAISQKLQELAGNQSYDIAVYFVVDESVWQEDVDGRIVIHEAFARFVDILAGCDGILVSKESRVVSGEEFSWQMMQLTDEWNFANLSHRE